MLERTVPYDDHENFVHVDWHYAGSGLQTPGSIARAQYYGVSSAPTTFFDGRFPVVGAGDSISAYNAYKAKVDTEYADLAKLIIDSQVNFDGDTNTATVNIDVEVAPGETIANANLCHIRLAVYQNDILLCCEPRTGNANWDTIGRGIFVDEILAVDTPGTVQNVNTTFAIDPAWDTQKLHAVAFVQRDTNKAVLQADYSNLMFDLEVFENDPLIRTTNAAMVEWTADVTYLGAVNDDVSITIDNSGLPVGWTTQVIHGLDSDPTSLTIPGMTANQVEPFAIRVTPNDGTAAKAAFTVTTAPAGNPSQGNVTTYTVFNNTEAILIVNDDNGEGNGTGAKIDAAVTSSGHFAIIREVSIEGNPEFSDLDGYDAVIWSTGGLQSNTIGASHQANLAQFMDGGGNVFIISQGLMNHQGLTPTIGTYLGVGSFSQDQQALNVTGVPGDIADGISFATTSGSPFIDFSDTINPNANSITWLTGHLGNSVALRQDMGTYKSAFMAVAIELVPNPQADQVVAAVLDWMFPGGSTDVNVGEGQLALALGRNAPNPFVDGTRMSFAVPHTGDVKVSVFNVAGRKVVDLVNGAVEAGQHTVEWNGRDASGRSVAAGVYLVRLETADGTRSREIVRLK
ncbi:MAG: T9SS type A sorting domain-containing protein [Gemmatimonadetes bacterium]|nr:T9SS type A sorting domain-containing protein [Gemmatimonadota bacterium]